MQISFVYKPTLCQFGGLLHFSFSTKYTNDLQSKTASRSEFVTDKCLAVLTQLLVYNNTISVLLLVFILKQFSIVVKHANISSFLQELLKKITEVPKSFIFILAIG